MYFCTFRFNRHKLKNEKIRIKYIRLTRHCPQFKSESGTKILKYLFNLCKINEINALYDRSCDYRGAAFCNSIIDDLDITCQIDHEEKLDNLPEGAFITVSNHPFGALDGVILIKLLANRRPDYKVMVNWILNHVEAMSDNFIAVDPYSNPDRRKVSLNGIKEALLQAKNGHPLRLFPRRGCLQTKMGPSH